MRQLRWKSRFRTGDASADRRNRAFVECLNKFINAASQREHCREMESLINQFSCDADKVFRERQADRDVRQEFGRRLLASLPLEPYGGNACRECGLCELAQDQVAEHLKVPSRCLFERSDP